MDIITEKNNMYIEESNNQKERTNEKKQPSVRMATQADFDRLR